MKITCDTHKEAITEVVEEKSRIHPLAKLSPEKEYTLSCVVKLHVTKERKPKGEIREFEEPEERIYFPKVSDIKPINYHEMIEKIVDEIELFLENRYVHDSIDLGIIQLDRELEFEEKIEILSLEEVKNEKPMKPKEAK